MGAGSMAFWLMKTEPEDYSWEQLTADGTGEWSGVRSHQAAANLGAMQPGDRAFFYRSQVDPAIVGIMTVTEAAYQDPTDDTGKWVAVRVAPERPLLEEVSLKAVKADGRFAGLALVRLGRLSVQSIDEEHWAMLCAMGGLGPEAAASPATKKGGAKRPRPATKD